MIKEFLIHSNFLTLYFIYFIKEEKILFSVFSFDISFKISNIIIILCILLIHFIFINIAKKKLSNDNEIKIVAIKQVNNKYLNNNMILYIIPFIISNDTIFNFIFVFLYLLFYFSNFYFYNPILVFFGYNYYEMKTNNGIWINVISKNKYYEQFVFNKNNIGKIDDYSYIDKS